MRSNNIKLLYLSNIEFSFFKLIGSFEAIIDVSIGIKSLSFANNISDKNPSSLISLLIMFARAAALANIIKREMSDDGFLSDILLAKDKLLIPIDTSIIASNDPINLKKLNSILDKYKSFILLLRKTLEEC